LWKCLCIALKAAAQVPASGFQLCAEGFLGKAFQAVELLGLPGGGGLLQGFPKLQEAAQKSLGRLEALWRGLQVHAEGFEDIEGAALRPREGCVGLIELACFLQEAAARRGVSLRVAVRVHLEREAVEGSFEGSQVHIHRGLHVKQAEKSVVSS